MFLLSVVRHTSKVLQAYNLPWKQHNFCSLGTFFCCNRSIILQFSICSFWEPVWSPNHESKWSGNLFYLILYLRARQKNRCLLATQIYFLISMCLEFQIVANVLVEFRFARYSYLTSQYWFGFHFTVMASSPFT